MNNFSKSTSKYKKKSDENRKFSDSRPTFFFGPIFILIGFLLVSDLSDVSDKTDNISRVFKQQLKSDENCNCFQLSSDFFFGPIFVRLFY